MKARDYFNAISYGYENGVERPGNQWIDRALRALINQANKTGDCIISGRGRYYKPISDREEEAQDARIYFAKELHRARDILYKRKMMMETYRMLK